MRKRKLEAPVPMPPRVKSLIGCRYGRLTVRYFSASRSNMKRPVIDLFCGLGGWADGLIAAGHDVIGFDIERHVYGSDQYPGKLVLQDALTLHGSQFRHASLIVASPPCQNYSYMAMPWSRGKARAAEIRADGTGRKLRDLNALFDTCFRIQREANTCPDCHGIGTRKCRYCKGIPLPHIPLVVENVKGAQPWVGKAAGHYGSFYLWGNVPTPVPLTSHKKNGGGGSWFAVSHGIDCGRIYGTNPVRGAAIGEGIKTEAHANRRDGYVHTPHLTNSRKSEGIKQRGSGAEWFDEALDQRRREATQAGSGSNSRKAASAQIAKIPFALARWIGECYPPQEL